MHYKKKAQAFGNKYMVYKERKEYIFSGGSKLSVFANQVRMIRFVFGCQTPQIPRYTGARTFFVPRDVLLHRLRDRVQQTILLAYIPLPTNLVLRGKGRLKLTLL